MAFRFARLSIFVLGAVAGSAIAGNSAPDMLRQHYERRDCHIAYDLIVETVTANRTVTQAERDWGVGYETAAKSGKPCPAPPDALLQKATNRLLSTGQGIAFTAQYLRQNDPAAAVEIALSSLQGKIAEVPPADGF